MKGAPPFDGIKGIKDFPPLEELGYCPHDDTPDTVGWGLVTTDRSIPTGRIYVALQSDFTWTVDETQEKQGYHTQQWKPGQIKCVDIGVKSLPDVGATIYFIQGDTPYRLVELL
jgi:hypothetical protein